MLLFVFPTAAALLSPTTLLLDFPFLISHTLPHLPRSGSSFVLHATVLLSPITRALVVHGTQVPIPRITMASAVSSVWITPCAMSDASLYVPATPHIFTNIALSSFDWHRNSVSTVMDISIPRCLLYVYT